MKLRNIKIHRLLTLPIFMLGALIGLCVTAFARGYQSVDNL